MPPKPELTRHPRADVCAFAPGDLPMERELALALDQHRLAHAAGVAEHAQITLDLRGQAGRLLRIVGELDGRMSVDRRHLADQRDRIEIERAVRRAADEIIGEVGAPAEGEPHPAGEVVIGLLDRADIHRVGEHQQLVLGIAALLLPPFR